MSENRGWLSRKLHRLTADDAELEAEELRDQVSEVGAVEMRSCPARSTVCVTGTIRSVTLKSLAGAPSLEAEIYDGTGSATAIFLGRRRIAGIETGRAIVLWGRVTRVEGQRTIYNPRYELLPADQPA